MWIWYMWIYKLMNEYDEYKIRKNYKKHNTREYDMLNIIEIWIISLKPNHTYLSS